MSLVPLIGPAIAEYFSSAEMYLEVPGTAFGRLREGQFALLLTLTFRNESERPTLIRLLKVQHAGVWHYPHHFHPPDLSLRYKEGKMTFELRGEHSVTISPQIPPMNQVTRYAFFHLTEPGEQWPGHLNFKVRAEFPRRKAREIVFGLTALGMVELRS